MNLIWNPIIISGLRDLSKRVSNARIIAGFVTGNLMDDFFDHFSYNNSNWVKGWLQAFNFVLNQIIIFSQSKHYTITFLASCKWFLPEQFLVINHCLKARKEPQSWQDTTLTWTLTSSPETWAFFVDTLSCCKSSSSWLSTSYTPVDTEPVITEFTQSIRIEPPNDNYGLNSSSFFFSFFKWECNSFPIVVFP